MPTGGNDEDAGGGSVGFLGFFFVFVSLTGIAALSHNVTTP